MSDRYVVPVEDGWHVEKDQAQRASAKTATQGEAIRRAIEIVANDGGGQVIIHGTDGKVRETRKVAAGAGTVTETVKAGASATDSGARAAGRSAADDAGAKPIADDAGDTAKTLADDAADTRRRVSGQTEAEGRQVTQTADQAAREAADEARAGLNGRESVGDAALGAASTADAATGRAGDQIERGARQVRGESRGAGGRTRERVARAVDRGEWRMVARGDRVEVGGQRLDDELETGAARAARKVHAVTEQVARPLDLVTDIVLTQLGTLSHVVNPVRLAGRAVGLGVAVALRLAGTVTRRGGRAASRSAHALGERG